VPIIQFCRAGHTSIDMNTYFGSVSLFGTGYIFRYTHDATAETSNLSDVFADFGE